MQCSAYGNTGDLVSSYNKVRAFAKRTGIFDEGRVNRAWGILMSCKLNDKVEQYGSTMKTCDCPDSQIRMVYCKHSIGLVIIEGSTRLDEDVFEWMNAQVEDEIPC